MKFFIRRIIDMTENNKINDEKVSEVSGGMIFYSEGSPDYDPYRPWEVINNNNGQVLDKFPTRDAAVEYAKRFGPDSYNTMDVGWGTVDRLRRNPNVF